MKIIKKGNQPKPWKKKVICNFLHKDGDVVCGAVLEIEKKDLKEDEFYDQDDRCTRYFYYTLCPTCGNKISVPELSHQQ